MRTIDLAAALARFPLLAVFQDAARETNACVWLVGGVVRDALLGRDTHDADLVTDGDPGAIAKAVGRAARATVVHLYDNPPTYRVVHGGIEYDLTALREATLDGDLHARDLTINALAALLGGDGSVIDVTGGLADLNARVVRGTSLVSFEADPLRALRVYRFAAELDFGVDPETRTWCSRVAVGLGEIADERIWEETRRLLATRRAAGALRRAASNGVLHAILGIDERDVEHAIGIVAALDDDEAIHDGDERDVFDDAVTLKLASLGWGRDAPVIARLSGPKRVRRAVDMILAHRDAPARMRDDIAGGADARQALADYALATGDAWLAVVRLDAASRSARGEIATDEWVAWLRVQYGEFVEPVLASPLVTGHDLMTQFGVSPGPGIGRALAAITRERIAGTVGTREEALSLALKIFRESVK